MTIEEIKKNCREGWHVNPNEKIVNGIMKGINKNEGNCPCDNDSEDKHCPCSNYRLHDKCCCRLYLKDEPKENDQKNLSKKEELKKKISELNAELKTAESELNKILDEERFRNEMKEFKDELQMQVIGDSVIILRGGLGKADPSKFLDKAVSRIVDVLGRDKHGRCKNYQVMEFIEETLDNPWVRVLVINANTMDFLDDFDDIKNKIKI